MPGLVNQAKPAFPEVDLFASHYYFERFARKRVYPWGSTNVMLRAEDPLPVIGTPGQQAQLLLVPENIRAACEA